ncbi:endolytic transglycosylase MltG [Crocinitomix catalasitica]|uniref:endolytic transglycosylase MltG n=1 Tax=Crocinitomix catalasitica TaxID=184607 RepID=UPI000486C9EC|nr:endolytic transglycosylase MltG [Crocinitomix catalasitica]
MKKIIILIVLLIIGGVGFYIGKPYYDMHFKTIALSVDQKIIYVHSDESLMDLAAKFEKEDIMSKKSFLAYATKLGLTDENLEPGKYRVVDGIKIKNIFYGFKNGNQELKDVKITFNNCLTIEDMAGKVAPNIEADSAQIVAYLNHTATIEKFGFNPATMISLFLPDTYEIGEWDTSAEEFVAFMAKKYKDYWNEDRKAKQAVLNISQSQIATLASIIEAEQGINTQEWPIIAGLYLNRVKRGILLQSDPTAKFCWGDELKGVKRLLTIHMQRDCPYNTYIYPGIPPGPIRMPSKQAIDAVLNAEQHDYIFMCAKPDNSGLHNFAKTNAQHNANAAKWHAYARKMRLR